MRDRDTFQFVMFTVWMFTFVAASRGNLYDSIAFVLKNLTTTDTHEFIQLFGETRGRACFDAVGWAAGRASGYKKKLSGGMLAWLSGMRCRLAYSPADATATHCLLLQ